MTGAQDAAEGGDSHRAEVDDSNRERRARWREVLETTPFAVHCSLRFEHWGEDHVVLSLPYREELTSYPGTLHGGALASAVDVAAFGAVMAGNDFRLKGRFFTASMTVNYLSSDPGQGLLVTARCTRRGASMAFVEARVASVTGKPVAEALVSLCRAATG